VRCVLARRRAVARACQVYRRIHDEEYDAHFYWHATTKRSVWAKPRLFLSQVHSPPPPRAAWFPQAPCNSAFLLCVPLFV